MAVGVVLAAVSGAVDVISIGFLGGAFASVMTGNLVVLGRSIGVGDRPGWEHVGVAVCAYGLGVLLGSLCTGVLRGRTDRVDPLLLLGSVELVLLVGMTAAWVDGTGALTDRARFAALALAATGMGLQSAAFRVVRVPGVTTTYFTGTLTGLLAGLATSGRPNVAAAVALVALLAGATASAVLTTHAVQTAPILPVALLIGALALRWVTRRREG